ncbi:MAG: hypothetical protein EOP36_16140 [Rubrivivax sp.]|nr:MAG: hypothetical protein EOP36_16140 [Rubrivivax sp.]
MTRLKATQLFAALALCAPLLGHAGVVVIAHPSVRKMDLATVQRIFMGKAIEVDGVRVSPTNGVAAMPSRQRFLAQYLQTDEDQYVAYWTVRRYVGKGTPPHEVRQTAEMIDYVSKTPGAVGYIDEAELPPGMNVVLKK